MDFTEFKKEMNQPHFGNDSFKYPEYSELLNTLSSKDQIQIIASLLEKGLGLEKKEGLWKIVPFEQSNAAIFPDLTSLLEMASEEDLRKIFTSPLLKKQSIDQFPDKWHWVFSFYNLRKSYAMLVLDLLQKRQPFAEWKGIVLPKHLVHQPLIELKPLILKILSVWPTEGRSGYALLDQLRHIPLIQPLMKDPDIQKAFEQVENHCDFGSLAKVQSLLNMR